MFFFVIVATAHPVAVVHPELVERVRRSRGKQKAPTKEQVTIRLDADITAHFRSGGRGWQTRLNDALREDPATGVRLLWVRNNDPALITSIAQYFPAVLLDDLRTVQQNLASTTSSNQAKFGASRFGYQIARCSISGGRSRPAMRRCLGRS